MPIMNLRIPQHVYEEINHGLNNVNARREEGYKCTIALSPDEIGQEALAYYRWAVKQASEGRAVVSTDLENRFEQLETPSFPALAPTK